MRNIFFKDKSVDISPSIVVFSVFFVIFLYFLFYIRTILVMLFSAIIIMAAINPAVEKLEKHLKVPRVAGILFMYVLLVTFFTLMLMLVVPPLAHELQGLARFNGFLDPIQDELRDFRFSLTELDGLLSSFGGSVNALFGIISSTFTGIFTVFTVLVMSSYLLIDRDSLYLKIGWFTRDKSKYKLAEKFIDDLEIQLGGWVRGQVILMIVIGVVTYLGLLAMGIPYALPLAILAGFLEILPNLGPTIASMPAILLGFAFGGWPMAGLTALFYMVVQQLENNIVVPRVMKANADVNPLATIVTILVGLQIAGVVGALLSVPVYIMFRSVYGLWYHNKI